MRLLYVFQQFDLIFKSSRNNINNNCNIKFTYEALCLNQIQPLDY